MTQVEFARTIGVPVATLRNWEQGRVVPDPAARALMRVLAREKEVNASPLPSGAGEQQLA
jgi:putative transcriptional regulator